MSDQAANSSMQRTPLRAAVDAERYTTTKEDDAGKPPLTIFMEQK